MVSRFSFRTGLGCFILSVMVLAAFLAGDIAPRDPLLTDLAHRLSPPGPGFPLGSDQLGRCVLSRVIYGARISLAGAAIASLLTMALGGAVGILAALGGRIRPVFAALIDMGLALPGLMLTLVLGGLLGGSLYGLVTGLILANWPWWARLIRNLTLTAFEKEFVLAGRAAGIRPARILFAYIFPQMKGPILGAGALKTGRIILAFSSLSYLGLGPAPPAPEWGRMIQESGIYMGQAPWLMLAPGAAITLVVAALNLIADGIQRP